MRTILLLIALAAPALASVDRSIEQRIIRMVEGVKDPARAGPAGELGYYRLTRDVWAQHTSRPFRLCATDHALEEQVAARHLDWLTIRLLVNGVKVTPYSLALAWNGGMRSAISGGNKSSKDYAVRVWNLYFDSTH